MNDCWLLTHDFGTVQVGKCVVDTLFWSESFRGHKRHIVNASDCGQILPLLPKVHSVFSNILFLCDQSGRVFAPVPPQVTPICFPSMLQVLYCVLLIIVWHICVHAYLSFIKFIHKCCSPTFCISSRVRRYAYSQQLYQTKYNKRNRTGDRNSSVLHYTTYVIWAAALILRALMSW